MEEINRRNAYLLEFNSLVKRCGAQLESLVESIGWTTESLTKLTQDEEENLAANPVVKANVTPEPSIGSNSEPKDLEKLYNEFLSNLPNQPKKNEEKAQTLAELLEIERNAKRRRISYKNRVHTKNKSHTEVLRALVHEQMEVLKVAGELPEDEILSKRDAVESENDGLIQINVSSGNPHLTWKKIPALLEIRTESDDRRDSAKDKANRYNLKDETDYERRKHSDNRDRSKGYNRRRESDEMDVRGDKYTRSDSRRYSKEENKNHKSVEKVETKDVSCDDEFSSPHASHRTSHHKRKKSSKKSKKHDKRKKRKRRSRSKSKSS